MNEAQNPGLFDKHSGAFTYLLVCLGGLTCLLLGLFQRGVGSWGLLPVVVALVAIVLRWRSGPVLTLLTVVWVILARGQGLDPFSYSLSLVNEVLYQSVFEPFGVQRGQVGYWPTRFLPRDYYSFKPLSDPFICAGVLTYVAGCFRLLSIVSSIFPLDPRRREPAAPGQDRKVKAASRPILRQRRSGSLVQPREITLLLITAAACTGSALLVWLSLSKQGDQLSRLDWLGRFEPSTWRAIMLIWMFGIGLIVVAGVLSHFGQGSAPREQAEIVLQDIIWRETIREQRRLMGWFAWARLRRKKHEVEP
jgi:hypothetical protein